MPRTYEDAHRNAARRLRGDTLAPDLAKVARAVITRARAERRLADAVAEARANGRSFGEIAALMNVTRQAARKRWGQR